MPRRETGCEAKKRYPTEKKAEESAAYAQRRGTPKLFAYYCHAWGGGWHLSKKNWGKA